MPAIETPHFYRDDAKFPEVCVVLTADKKGDATQTMPQTSVLARFDGVWVGRGEFAGRYRIHFERSDPPMERWFEITKVEWEMQRSREAFVRELDRRLAKEFLYALADAGAKL